MAYDRVLLTISVAGSQPAIAISVLLLVHGVNERLSCDLCKIRAVSLGGVTRVRGRTIRSVYRFGGVGVSRCSCPSILTLVTDTGIDSRTIATVRKALLRIDSGSVGCIANRTMSIPIVITQPWRFVC